MLKGFVILRAGAAGAVFLQTVFMVKPISLLVVIWPRWRVGSTFSMGFPIGDWCSIVSICLTQIWWRQSGIGGDILTPVILTGQRSSPAHCFCQRSDCQQRLSEVDLTLMVLRERQKHLVIDLLLVWVVPFQSFRTFLHLLIFPTSPTTTNTKTTCCNK